MAKSRKTLAKLVIGLAFCGLAAGCIGDDSGPTFVVLPVGPTDVRLGESLQFTSTRPDAIWIVIGSPETGTIDPFGLYRAPDILPDDPLVTIFNMDGTDQAFATVNLVP